MMRGPGLEFLQWVQLYISDTLSQWMIAANQPKDDFSDYHIRISKKIKRHKIHMNPPISVEEINSIEQIHNITLPKDYVQFITTIGDGGELPVRFDGKKMVCRIRSIRECDFSRIREPFPLTNTWRFGWDWKTKKVQYDIEMDPEGKWKAAQNGQLCFMNLTNPKGEKFSYSLIVNGSQYGKVWVCLDGSILNSGCRNFQHWFEMFIHERCV